MMRTTACLLALLAPLVVVASSRARAAGGLDDFRETEEFGRLFVEAVNSADAEFRLRTARMIFSELSPPEGRDDRRIDLMQRVSSRLGALEFHHAEVSTMVIGDSKRHSMHLFVRSAGDGGWKDLQFRLDPDPPHRIAELVFIADVAEPVYLPNGPITAPHVIDWLNGYVDRLVSEEDLSGAILIATRDRILIERYFGFADSARSRPCGPETRFNLGSGNKMFTALAAAKLVAEGRLSYGSELTRFFPDFPDSSWIASATLGHLLSHTSGLNEYWTGSTDAGIKRLRTMRELLPVISAAGTGFRPGARAEYSNSNFVLAGLVVEAASGVDYFDFIRRTIYEPCGMVDTDSYPMDGSIAGLAEPLVGKPRAWRIARGGYRGTAAGGGFSTARDILRFSRCLVDGKIVPAEVLAEMTRSHTEHLPDTDLDYGYGFLRERGADGAASFGHGGIARGVNFEYRYFPGRETALIAFCNQDNGAYDSLRKTATRLITEER